MQVAKEARENAYAPYSGFKVGAALLACDGTVYTGANVENASYGLSLCAERAALAHAVSSGARDFRALAIIGGSEEPLVPCGACLQWITELAPDIWLILGNLKGKLSLHRGRELLPLGFTKDFLGSKD